MTSPNANPELHWSQLKRIAESPAHYKYRLTAPNESTPQMAFGTLVHAMLLGGDFVVYKETKTRSGKKWDDFEAKNVGALIVTASEEERALAIAEKVRNHPLAAPLLNGDKEVKWEKKLYGRTCAGRVDLLGSDFICDLKTSATTQPDRFGRLALRMAYHAQLAWYRDAIGKPSDACYILGVETRAPYAVTVLKLTERALLEGGKLNRLWLEKLAACEDANEWPEYSQSTVELDVVDDAGIEIDTDGVE